LEFPSMSSGNTFGLSDISHFGAFQRVGGKAGGFINKKFFHPSTLRNQEKLWLAMTADERERKKQGELEKRRDEERQVEELRKQMYLSGQGKASDFASSASSQEDLSKRLSAPEKTEQKAALEEQKRRRELLKKERSAREAINDEGDHSEDDGQEAAFPSASPDRTLARSRYEEDVYVHGHRSVWGSWYSREEKQWGFACCKTQDVSADCPLEPEPTEETPSKAQARGRKRRRRGGAAETGDPADGEAAEPEPEAPQGGLQGRATTSSSSGAPDAPLIDERMLQAAARRKEERMIEERKREEAKKSGYLADLLSDPTAG
jgi:hypothetical protein